MKHITQQKFHLFCALFLVFCIVTPLAVAAEKPLVLIVRPEKLQRSGMIPQNLIKRDPFNWSAEQRRKFKHNEEQLLGNVFENLHLNGIIWGYERPFAVINDHLVGIGDKVGGVTVTHISKSEVEVAGKGLRKVMQFTPQISGLSPSMEND